MWYLCEEDAMQAEWDVYLCGRYDQACQAKANALVGSINLGS